jgi:AraC-like DNA-binding protein
LVRSQASAERVGTVAAFLLSRLQPATDTLALRAAAHLRRDPALRMRQLADRLDITPRHLGRLFRSVLRMSPKRFARLARLEHIIRLRQRGLAWVDIACDCGLADLAHLIREFEALVGARPTDFFAHAGSWVSDATVCGPFVIRPMMGEV